MSWNPNLAKKIIAPVAAVALSLGATACSANESDTKKPAQPAIDTPRHQAYAIKSFHGAFDRLKDGTAKLTVKSEYIVLPMNLRFTDMRCENGVVISHVTGNYGKIYEDKEVHLSAEHTEQVVGEPVCSDDTLKSIVRADQMLNVAVTAIPRSDTTKALG